MATRETQPLQPEKPAEPGTAVGPLSPQAQLRETRNQMRAVQKEIRNTSWGKDLPDGSVKAIVLWCEKRGIDAATEVTVLGGNIYLEADYYLRRLAHMVGDGRIEYARADHVHFDQRLVDLFSDENAPADVREQAKAEHFRRVLERSKHNLSEKAAACCIYRIKVKGMSDEFTGAKAVGNRIREKDPVGDQFPMETSESRAARRACRQLIDTFPDLKAEMDVIEAEAELVSIEVQAGREAIKREAARPSLLAGGQPVRSGGYDEIGSEREAIEAEGSTARVLSADEQAALDLDEDRRVIEQEGRR